MRTALASRWLLCVPCPCRGALARHPCAVPLLVLHALHALPAARLGRSGSPRSSSLPLPTATPRPPTPLLHLRAAGCLRCQSLAQLSQLSQLSRLSRLSSPASPHLPCPLLSSPAVDSPLRLHHPKALPSERHHPLRHPAPHHSYLETSRPRDLTKYIHSTLPECGAHLRPDVNKHHPSRSTSIHTLAPHTRYPLGRPRRSRPSPSSCCCCSSPYLTPKQTLSLTQRSDNPSPATRYGDSKLGPTTGYAPKHIPHRHAFSHASRPRSPPSHLPPSLLQLIPSSSLFIRELFGPSSRARHRPVPPYRSHRAPPLQWRNQSRHGRPQLLPSRSLLLVDR